MPKYRVTTKSFINNAIVEEGAIVEFDGVPGDNLEPLDKPAEVAAAAAIGENAESKQRQALAVAGVDLTDPIAVEAARAAQATAAAAVGRDDKKNLIAEIADAVRTFMASGAAPGGPKAPDAKGATDLV